MLYNRGGVGAIGGRKGSGVQNSSVILIVGIVEVALLFLLRDDKQGRVDTLLFLL